MVGTESLSGKSIAIAPTKSTLLGLTDLFSSASGGKQFTVNTYSLRVKQIDCF